MGGKTIKMRLRPRGLLLDFYGTVVQEDDAAISRICSEIAEASPSGAMPAEIATYWGRQFTQLCRESVGESFRLQKELERLSLEKVLIHFEAGLDARMLSRILYDYWAGPSVFPESRSVLSQCNVPVCLVSNIDNAELRLALDCSGLSFDHIVTSQDCRAYKPRPQMFEKAMAILRMKPDQVLCVGDSLLSDVCGAKALGIPALWTNRKQRPIPSGRDAPDYVSNDLTGLLAVLNGQIES